MNATQKSNSKRNKLTFKHIILHTTRITNICTYTLADKSINVSFVPNLRARNNDEDSYNHNDNGDGDKTNNNIHRAPRTLVISHTYFMYFVIKFIAN